MKCDGEFMVVDNIELSVCNMCESKVQSNVTAKLIVITFILEARILQESIYGIGC